MGFIPGMELKSLYSKVSGYEVNIKESITFLILAMNNWDLKLKKEYHLC